MPAELYSASENYKRKPTVNLGPLSAQGSTNLYWNRALLELEGLDDLTPALKRFLLDKFKDDPEMLEKLRIAMQPREDSTSFAEVMDAGMDWLYLFCNVYNTVAPLIKPLAMAVPGVGVAWNLFDTIGATALAAYEGREGDQWAKKVNYASAIQLSACTGVTIASLFLPAVSALGLAGTATGGFGFAAAMAISWALEERAVKLCDARIDYLVNEKIQDVTVTQQYNAWRKAIDNSKGDEIVAERRQNLNNSLDDLEKNLTIQGNKPEKLLAVKMCRKQVKERELHSRMCSVWKFCTMAMTAVAIVGVVALAVGVSVSTCGIGLAVGASALAAVSAGYRIYQKKTSATSRARRWSRP